jgi:tetratricopeptide (TPR) repeat protein
MAGRRKRASRRAQDDSAPPPPTPPESPCYDVFISYSSRDKNWVQGELLPRIEQAGLKAFIDFRDFTRGAPSIKEMERGVVECRKTLVVLTPDYVKSGWAEVENIMVQTLDPANRDLRLIPLLKRECDKPLRIGALTHIDFTDGADLDLAWRQLRTALGAPPELPTPAQPQRDDWFLAHPYPMPPNFTGRLAERKMLTDWLNADVAHPLLVLRALGGFGKSALVWHWLTHDVAPAAWPCVVWWSFYESDSSFDHFLAETLRYLSKEGFDARKMSGKDAVTRLVQVLHKTGTLLILDGFERELRAYGGPNAAYQGDESAKSEDNECDCISPLADLFLYNVALQPDLRSKVLLTTRLRPHVLEARGGTLLQGCREKELRQMQPADAVEFFRAQGIRGRRDEIEQACEPYGYHPLSLRLLAGWIVGDLQQPGDIASAKRLDIAGDLVARQHHVLEQAYESLMPERRALLTRIACFRNAVKHEALKALTAASAMEEQKGLFERMLRWHGSRQRDVLHSASETLDTDLRDLVARGLLHHDTKEGRFDLHPIVRRYAYDRLTTRDRKKAHTHLRDYFAAVPPPDKVARLKHLTPVIELYHHTVRAGQFDEALTLFRDRLTKPLYYQLGAYQLRIELLRALFPDDEERPPRLKGESAQAWTLNALANSYSLSGQLRRAVPLFEQHNAICEKLGSKSNLAIGLGNVADDRLKIGALRAAEANLRRSIALCREINDEFQEAIGHQELGRLLAYRGVSAESETELAAALKMADREKHAVLQGVTCAYRALRELLLLRSASHPALRTPRSALDSARCALELADEWRRADYPLEREYVRAHWLLGAAHRVAGQFDEAERHLHQALERCRRINMVDHEADILIDLARLRSAIGSSEGAQRLAEEALLITERCEYVLQGADAHLELAKLAFARGDKAAGLEHAQKAKELATCDGPPDYTYKAAYDEGCSLLGEL